MMKTLFSFLFVFLFLLSFGQKLRDSLWKSDCTDFHKREKLYYDSLSADFKKVDFSDLSDKIINEIDMNNFKSNHLIVYLRPPGIFCPMDLIREDECHNDLNIENPMYNLKEFCNEKTFILLGKTLNKNVIPAESELSFYENEKKKFKRYSHLNTSNFEYRDKIYLYFKKNENPVDIEKADNIYFYFRNVLDKKIEVYIYKNYRIKLQKLIFQYKNREWKLIYKEI